MANTTKISNHRLGSPRYGTRGYKDDWDNSVKVSYLSPEELEEYRNGKRGGMKLYTYDDYQKMKDAGKSNAEIAKEMKISDATLYNRLKVWKKEPLESVEKHHENAPQPDTAGIKQKECSCKGKEKNVEYQALIAELKSKLEHSTSEKDELVQKLENEVAFWKQHAEKLSSDWSEKEAVSDEGPDYHELFNQTMDKNDHLQKEIITLEDRLESISTHKQELQKKYNELLDDFYTLKEETGPLRQLVMIGLRNKVEVLK